MILFAIFKESYKSDFQNISYSPNYMICQLKYCIVNDNYLPVTCILENLYIYITK